MIREALDSNFLLEGRIDDAKRIAPTLAMIGGLELIKKIDPSNNLKYLAWIAKQFERDAKNQLDSIRKAYEGRDLPSDEEVVRMALSNLAPVISSKASLMNSFHSLANKKLIKNSDINFYKGWNDLLMSVAKAKKEENRRIKRKQEEKKYYIIHKADDLVVMEPMSHAASCKYGKGTRWCITMDTDNYWNMYTRDGGRFAFFFKKTEPDEKYAMLVKDDGKTEIYDSADALVSMSILEEWVGADYDEIISKIESRFEVELEEAERLDERVDEIENSWNEALQGTVAGNLMYYSAEVEDYGDGEFMYARVGVQFKIDLNEGEDFNWDSEGLHGDHIADNSDSISFRSFQENYYLYPAENMYPGIAHVFADRTSNSIWLSWDVSVGHQEGRMDTPDEYDEGIREVYDIVKNFDNETIEELKEVLCEDDFIVGCKEEFRTPKEIERDEKQMTLDLKELFRRFLR